MPLPIAGIVSGLFGGDSTKTAAAAGPVDQTVTTGPITLGSKYLGRGSVTSSDTQASGGAAVTAPSADNLPLYLVAGAVVIGAIILLISRKS